LAAALLKSIGISEPNAQQLQDAKALSSKLLEDGQ
jgi:hypothetical protein